MTAQTRSPDFRLSRRPWLIVELLVLAAVLLAVYLAHAEKAMMHIDENHFIATSNVLELFLAGDRTNAAWAESYLTLTAPPSTRYVAGIGRALGWLWPGRSAHGMGV